MPLEVQILSVIFGVLGTVGALSAILWFKIKKKELETRGSDPELGPVVDALRDDVEQLADIQESTRAQLVDLQERLDFAERLLTAGPSSQDDKSN